MSKKDSPKSADSALYYSQKALELAPGDANVLSAVGFRKCVNNQFEEGLALLDKAESLDPLSWISFANKAWGNTLAQRHDIAELSLRKWLQHQPKAGYVNGQIAFCLLEQGKLDEAEVFAEQERFLGIRRCAQSIVAWKKGNRQEVGILKGE